MNIRNYAAFILAAALSVPSASCGTGENQIPVAPPAQVVDPSPSEGDKDKPATDTDPFELKGSLQADASLVGKDLADIHQYMRSLGWDASENPNASDKDHRDGVHCMVVKDDEIDRYVFRFIIHANADVLDGDRGSVNDRQRNEMKSQTSAKWYNLNGNWGERQRLEWMFKIPAGFQPSTSFCHIHQLKAQEGNNGAPLITITPRCNADGSNKRVQVIHTGDDRSSSKGTIIDNLPFSDFEGQWVKVTTEMLYTHNGEFAIKIERVSDGKVIVDRKFTDIDLWRKGATNIRNKFGIYRSYGSKMADANDRPHNGIKDEMIDLADFKVYECLTNPAPSAHD